MLSIVNEVDSLIFRYVCFVYDTNMYFSNSHNSGIGSSLLACDNTAIASTSLSIPNQVVPGFGSLASPPFTARDTTIGLPLVLSSKLPDQLPLYTQRWVLAIQRVTR